MTSLWVGREHSYDDEFVGWPRGAAHVLLKQRLDIHTHMLVHVYMRVHIHVCIYICVHAHEPPTHTHLDRCNIARVKGVEGFPLLGKHLYITCISVCV